MKWHLISTVSMLITFNFILYIYFTFSFSKEVQAMIDASILGGLRAISIISGVAWQGLV